MTDLDPQQSVDERLNVLSNIAAGDELKKALAELEVLPFRDDSQKSAFFETVRRLQTRHVIQCFKFGVAERKNPSTENSQFCEEVINIFELCFFFCYTADTEKRIAFDYFARALKFCFPEHSSHCLSTAILSKLLQLVQIFHAGKLATIVCDNTTQVANPNLRIKGAKSLFDEVLAIFQTRRDQGHLADIVDQTIRFASKDASISCIGDQVAGWPSDHVVTPVLLSNWVKLLKFEQVSNDFACALAKMDDPCCTKQHQLVLDPHFPVRLLQAINVYESKVCYFADVLENMKSTNMTVTLPLDEERLRILCGHIHHFNCHSSPPSLRMTSLKLFANSSVSNGVLEDILDQYFHKEGPSLPNLKIGEQSLQPEFPQTDAFELVFEALKLYPDGRLVNRLLQFWKENVTGDQDYIALSHLFGLLLQGSKSERQSHSAESASKTVDFVVSTCLRIPQSLKPLVTFWCAFLASFLKIFPASYQSRQDVLVHLIKKAQELINKAVERLEDDFFCFFHLGLKRPVRPYKLFGLKTGEEFDDDGDELRLIINFLEWIAQQCCTEEMKGEMMFLLMSCIRDKISSLQDFQFSVYVIKQLSLGQHKNFIIKKELIKNFISLAKLFKEREVKNVFREVAKGLASDQNLELKDEIFSEILHLVRRCSSAKTIPPDTLQLFSLVSSCRLSGDRRVKVLQRSMETGKGLSCGLQILQLVQRRPNLVMEEENKYFDLLFSAFFDVLREDKDMCLQFYTQQVSVLYSPQVILHLCCSEVPRLISSGMFQEIESQWCLPVFQHVPEVNSPTEMLALYFQVRESAGKVVERVGENPGNEGACQRVEQRTFIEAMVTVVESNVLTCQEKLSLVEKVCEIFERDPSNLTKETVENALRNMIPFSQLQNDDKTINKDVMRLELNEIETILENPAMMSQISRLPTSLNNSLWSLFSTKTSGYCLGGKLADIYYFIGSQEHLDEAFFANVVAILKVAAEESNSLKDVIELLKEVVTFVRGDSSELNSFIMDSFRYLLENRVPKQERGRFMNDVVQNWGFLPNFPILSYLEVPRLLWRVYSSIVDSSKRCELIVRVQVILQKTNNLQTLCNELGYNYIRRRIACCDLELLVLNSSVSTDEAALAYELSSSLFGINRRLRCFTLSDVHIHEGCFKFIAHETRSQTAESRSRDEILNASSAEENKGNSSPAIDSAVLTPASIALKMIEHVKRTLRKEEDLAEVVSLLWDRSFGHKRLFCGCEKSLTFYDDYLNVVLSIISEASSTEIMLHWANVNSHFVYQCSEVILMACKKRCEADDDGEDLLKFQAVVSATLEKMRAKQSETNAPFLHRDRCFLSLKPQLKQLSGILERGLLISVKTKILNLFQTNFPAAVTLADVVSSWSNQDEARKLVEKMHLYCQEEEVPSQNEFVWQLLKAFGLLCQDSSDKLMAKFKKLLSISDPHDEYGFNRLPKWRETMIANGFSSYGIDYWCVAFLTTPLEQLSSRDVDAIVDLNSNSQQIGSAISEEINRCIFPKDDFDVTITLGRGIKEPSTKERLRLARLLGEFINMLKLRKPEENRKDAVIKQIVVEACDELCKAYKKPDKRRNGGDLYMIQEKVLKALFTEVFGKQYKSDAGVDSGGEASPAVNAESRGQFCLTRQSSYLHENLPHILSHNEVFEPLLVLLRRWLSRSAVKPTLASHTQGVVQQIFSIQWAGKESDRKSACVAVDPELHRQIRAHMLSLEENQTLIAQLQASGYNQTTQGTQNLWSSSTLEVSGYISKREFADSKRFLKKMTQNLRSLWDEWKHILFALGKVSVKVDGNEVRTRDLFSLQTTLEVMEKQVSAVKEAVNQIELGDLKRRVKQLMRKEQRCRERIEKLYKSKVRSSCFLIQILIIDLVLIYS